MAKKIMQFRYYGDGNSKNYPQDITANLLKSGDIFTKYDCYPIIELGIQTLPGSMFYLNSANTSIKIGSTGIYELDLEGYTVIDRLAFDQDSLKLISNNPSSYLLVDIICDKQEVNK